jgi:hypothetical protein
VKIVSDERHERHSHSRTIKLEDGPIVTIPETHWANKGRNYQATAVHVSWSHGAKPQRVHVDGLLLNKNGKPGKAHVGMEYDLTGKGWEKPAPEWVKELILKEAHE